MKRLVIPDEGQSGVDKALYLVSLFTIVGAFLLGGLLLYWSFEPDNVYSIEDHRIDVTNSNNTVKKDEMVNLEFSFCKLMETDGTVQRNFVTRATVLTGVEIPENVGKACVNNVKVLVPIPPQAVPREYRIQYVGRYQVNPIKTVEETFYSEPFTIVE